MARPRLRSRWPRARRSTTSGRPSLSATPTGRSCARWAAAPRECVDVKSRSLGMVLLLCAGVGVAGCGGASPKADPVAEQFVAAVQSADYTTAAKLAGTDGATLGAPYPPQLPALPAQKGGIPVDPPTPP